MLSFSIGTKSEVSDSSSSCLELFLSFEDGELLIFIQEESLGKLVLLLPPITPNLLSTIIKHA